MRNTVERKRTGGADVLMFLMLEHANPEWRDQGSVGSEILHPRNIKQDEKAKNWSDKHESGQADDKVERQHEMVGVCGAADEVCKRSMKRAEKEE